MNLAIDKYVNIRNRNGGQENYSIFLYNSTQNDNPGFQNLDARPLAEYCLALSSHFDQFTFRICSVLNQSTSALACWYTQDSQQLFNPLGSRTHFSSHSVSHSSQPLDFPARNAKTPATSSASTNISRRSQAAGKTTAAEG